MAKEENNTAVKINRIYKLTIVAVAIATFSIVLGLINIISNSSEDKIEYDVSMMHAVGVQDVLDMFDDGETHVLYIGRETCDICVDILPVLQQTQIRKNFITQYLDIKQVDFGSTIWKDLVKKLDIETQTTLTTDNNSELVTNTFGYFLDLKGFTPCIIVIKDGKQVAGFFGAKEMEAYEDWLSEYGI